MKKTILFMTAVAFIVALGAVSAKAADKPYNGVTDFSGRTYDSGALASIQPSVEMNAAVEHESAGGHQLAAAKWNGVTDFTGGIYDSGAIAKLASVGEKIASVERSSAGGPRVAKKAGEFHNGVTDFSGGIYDDTIVK